LGPASLALAWASEVATGERHNNALRPFSDHARQFQANALLGGNGDRLAIDELAQKLDFQITQVELHQVAPTDADLPSCRSGAAPAP
jgi:hypothetical protein